MRDAHLQSYIKDEADLGNPGWYSPVRYGWLLRSYQTSRIHLSHNSSSDVSGQQSEVDSDGSCWYLSSFHFGCIGAGCSILIQNKRLVRRSWFTKAFRDMQEGLLKIEDFSNCSQLCLCFFFLWSWKSWDTVAPFKDPTLIDMRRTWTSKCGPSVLCSDALVLCGCRLWRIGLTVWWKHVETYED